MNFYKKTVFQYCLQTYRPHFFALNNHKFVFRTFGCFYLFFICVLACFNGFAGFTQKATQKTHKLSNNIYFSRCAASPNEIQISPFALKHAVRWIGHRMKVMDKIWKGPQRTLVFYSLENAYHFFYYLPTIMSLHINIKIQIGKSSHINQSDNLR